MLSVQGATSGQQVPGVLCHISTHAPRAGSDPLPPCSEQPCTISIHAPRAGSDPSPCPTQLQFSDISIHAPRAGSDPGGSSSIRSSPSISIHAPRAGSDRAFLRSRETASISIHAPRAGSDLLPKISSMVFLSFQSTLPVRGATPRKRGPRGAGAHISIHAPRAGSDGDRAPALFLTTRNFNPRSPCGERRRPSGL